MVLEGSCHCGAVRFSVTSSHPYPFNLCYCSICRKTAGGGGFAINIKGDTDSLSVEGREQVRVYRARLGAAGDDDAAARSPAERHFCGLCASALWVWDPRWPEMLHPFASAIDTPLPVPPERTHLMVAFKPAWAAAEIGPNDRRFDEYPDESITDWHARLGLVDSD